MAPAEIVAFVEREFAGVGADCIFLSCTNWQAIDAISVLRQRLSVPVLSSNQATIEAVRARSANFLADVRTAADNRPQPQAV